MNSKIISAIDIGCSKICCMIAQIESQGDIKILGSAVKQSHGIKRGHIHDINAAAEAIRAAAQAAERMAGINIGRNIITNINGFRPKIQSDEKYLILDGKAIRQEDITALRNEARYGGGVADYQLLHYFERGFRLDEQNFTQKNPLSMNCRKLSLKSQLLFAPTSHIQQLKQLMQLCQLHVGPLIYTPYAAAQAVLLPQERQLGTILLDIGAETASLCVYRDDSPILCDYIGFGGHHITLDIASGLSIPVNEAERLKTLYGNLLEISADKHDYINIRHLGEDSDSHPISKSRLMEIIRPRVMEILELLATRLQQGHIDPTQVQNIVITGGTANLPGLAELISREFARPTRFGKPQSRFKQENSANSGYSARYSEGGGASENTLLGEVAVNENFAVSGLAAATTGAQFACIIGMLRYASSYEANLGRSGGEGGDSLWSQLWHWVMQDPI